MKVPCDPIRPAYVIPCVSSLLSKNTQEIDFGALDGPEVEVPVEVVPADSSIEFQPPLALTHVEKFRIKQFKLRLFRFGVSPVGLFHLILIPTVIVPLTEYLQLPNKCLLLL